MAEEGIIPCRNPSERPLEIESEQDSKVAMSLERKMPPKRQLTFWQNLPFSLTSGQAVRPCVITDDPAQPELAFILLLESMKIKKKINQ
ncbi:hypothetical protein PV327_009709 [Microctonus hyperodae]|uniref:Uncharacterized protein n=1 Tax=Microctonus hyperodae TaxID=165561 RepID=A0AA39CB09_MICHY|nr:hypothetical protein PV327_009709 [Microctonus hyperodae]